MGFFADGKLKRIDLTGGALQVLANAPYPRGRRCGHVADHRRPQLDGGTEAVRPSHLNLVANWFEELRHRVRTP